MQSYIVLNGIHLYLTARYSHQPAVGIIERVGGWLALLGRTIRINAGLPVPTFIWPEIMKTAAYLANRLPIQSTWMGFPP